MVKFAKMVAAALVCVGTLTFAVASVASTLVNDIFPTGKGSTSVSWTIMANGGIAINGRVEGLALHASIPIESGHPQWLCSCIRGTLGNRPLSGTVRSAEGFFPDTITGTYAGQKFSGKVSYVPISNLVSDWKIDGVIEGQKVIGVLTESYSLGGKTSFSFRGKFGLLDISGSAQYNSSKPAGGFTSSETIHRS
jgi:hypothetical protein